MGFVGRRTNRPRRPRASHQPHSNRHRQKILHEERSPSKVAQLSGAKSADGFCSRRPLEQQAPGNGLSVGDAVLKPGRDERHSRKCDRDCLPVTHRATTAIHIVSATRALQSTPRDTACPNPSPPCRRRRCRRKTACEALLSRQRSQRHRRLAMIDAGMRPRSSLRATGESSSTVCLMLNGHYALPHSVRRKHGMTSRANKLARSSGSGPKKSSMNIEQPSSRCCSTRATICEGVPVSARG